MHVPHYVLISHCKIKMELTPTVYYADVAEGETIYYLLTVLTDGAHI